MKKSTFTGKVNKIVHFNDDYGLLEITVIAPKELRNHPVGFVISRNELPSMEISVGTMVKISYCLDLRTKETDHLRCFTKLKLLQRLSRITDETSLCL